MIVCECMVVTKELHTHPAVYEPCIVARRKRGLLSMFDWTGFVHGPSIVMCHIEIEFIEYINHGIVRRYKGSKWHLGFFIRRTGTEDSVRSIRAFHLERVPLAEPSLHPPPVRKLHTHAADVRGSAFGLSRQPQVRVIRTPAARRRISLFALVRSTGGG